MGLRAWGSGLRVWGFGLGVWGLGLGAGLRAQGSTWSLVGLAEYSQIDPSTQNFYYSDSIPRLRIISYLRVSGSCCSRVSANCANIVRVI